MNNFVSQNYYERLMVISIIFFSFFFTVNDQVSKVFQLIFIIGSLPILFINRRLIFKDGALKILAFAIAIQLISWIGSLISFPEFANDIPKLDRLAKLFSFFFIAYWLKGKLENVYFVWFALVVGVVVACFTQADFFTEVTKAFDGERVDFAFKNAQFTSMLSGLSLIICVFTLNQLFNKEPPFNKINNSIRLILASVTVVITLLMLLVTLISQSRQVWLALTLVILITPIFRIMVIPNVKRNNTLVLYSSLLVLLLSMSQSEIIQYRLLKESGTVQAIVSGNFDNIPMTSIGIRVNSWIEAIHWIKNKPLIGSGSEAIKQVIQQSSKFTGHLKGFGHLHNYHIETLVAYGVLGLLVVYSLYYWVVRSLFILRKKESFKGIDGILLLSLVFMLFWLIINHFETFNGRSLGVNTHNIMLGCFYTFYLNNHLKVQRESA
ncbi:O-antigen ligase [Vibrio crassostreae]|uniref:O-antigen ligase family protein n=1 Tax=Vibrio crassostreae TaxID=246167 RepID=UPI00104C2CB3|nr:O-antigen ligase family protein [Vibrio crassostreae]TCN84385.1 O-antigen ligase [Vibrio crassostreae]CAK2408279.1 O-antigen ligase [Vibrio crassostreae]CAK2415451.1 O-antigen ligase [Vibrio crassostreae]CAK3606183.1 O-antigen ligase [Vibrio crassostreae]CAK3793925.1 O-antigen ligase [Vibrio crassostreae]